MISIKNIVKTFDLDSPLNQFQLKLFKEFLNDCLKNNKDSTKIFQDIFGKDIYDFPSKTDKWHKENGGAFYVYCLNKGRIFKKFLTYKGECSVKSYRRTALNHLYIDWLRTNDFVNAIELSKADLDAYEDGKAGYYNEGDLFLYGHSICAKEFVNNLMMLLDSMPIKDQIYFKLSVFPEIGLKLNDIKNISVISMKSVKDIIHSLKNLEQRIKVKIKKYEEKEKRFLDTCLKVFEFENKIKRFKQLTTVDKAKEIKALDK